MRAAFAVSLALHLLLSIVAVLVARRFVRAILPSPRPSVVSVVTIEHPAPVVRTPAPHPRPAQRRAAPRPSHHAVALRPAGVPHPEPTTRSVPPPPRPLASPIPVARATTAPQQVAAAPKAETLETDAERAARIQRDVAAMLAGEAAAKNPLNVPSPAPARATPFHLSIPGQIRRLIGAEGLCNPIKSWTQSGFDYYYVACNVVHSDNTYAYEPVPWPVRFPPDADPFVGTVAHDVPLSPPLPGWKPGPRDVIDDDLRAYARSKGANL